MGIQNKQGNDLSLSVNLLPTIEIPLAPHQKVKFSQFKN